jgi:hypothetical protein
MTDQQAIAETILGVLNQELTIAFSGTSGAYDLDQVPATPPTRYVVIRVRRYEDANRRLGGDPLPMYFLDTIYRADSVENCRALRRVVSATLDAQSVGEYVPTFNDETQPIDDDPDWKWSGVDTWSFC